MKPARMASLGYELATPVDDAELADVLGCTAAEVERMGRGRLRTFAPDGVGPSHLAAGAARKALAAAGREAGDVDFFIFSTNTPDFTFPGSACLLQAEIGARTVGCLDVRSVCTGFLVALDLARRYVATDTYRRVLVAAAEVPSHQNRFDGVAPELTCLTADAGTAVLVEGGAAPVSLLACRARTDGRLYRQLWCEFPASRHMRGPTVKRGERLTREAIEEGRIYPTADFDALRATALEKIPAILDEVLSEAGIQTVDAAIVAHVDPDTEAAVAERLGGRVGRVIESSQLYCYSSTLPLALARSVEIGSIGAGETVALVTAGGSASWGAALVRT